MSTTDRIPLILDVDTGIDDSLALLYAASSPEAEIVAITALSGNVHVDDTERNTRAVLELAGRTDIEVAAGASGRRCSVRSRSRPRRTARTGSGMPSSPSRRARGASGSGRS